MKQLKVWLSLKGLKKNLFSGAILLMLFSGFIFMLPYPLFEYLRYELFFDKRQLSVSMQPIHSQIHTMTLDSSSRLVLAVNIKDLSGRPVENAFVKLSTEYEIPIAYSTPGATIYETATITGSLRMLSERTDQDGQILAVFAPFDDAQIEQKIRMSAHSKEDRPVIAYQDPLKVSFIASIPNTKIQAYFSLNLIRVPVILVHGYQSSPEAFENLSQYLSTRGWRVEAFSYSSENGVAPSAEELLKTITQQKNAFLEKGIAVQRFDILAHSMGGLVARYYTASHNFAVRNDVRKLIFISVPQKGSYLASLGLAVFEDSAMKDLLPQSSLFTTTFPQMLNGGLNSTLQIGSILGQYDEVVTQENASLEEWQIPTEIFNVGENHMTVDHWLKGNRIESTNHQAVLHNTKIFTRILEMLTSSLPYPVQKG